MAIVKTTYESGAVAYEYVESLVQTGDHTFRLYGKTDFQERELNKGDRLEVLGESVVAHHEDCPDVTIPSQDGSVTFGNEFAGLQSIGILENVAERLCCENTNAEYLKESEKAKDEMVSIEPELVKMYHELFYVANKWRKGGYGHWADCIAYRAKLIAEYLGDC